MKIEYICHACLLFDMGALKIVTDPWFAGPAYCGQWHVFPKPVNLDVLNEVDTILISHGHEDHLHEPSLRPLPKRARVFYPRSWFGGTKEFIQSLGFADVQEAVTHKTYQLSRDTRVTYLANTHDNIMVIENAGRVYVNINDALHSYPPPVIDFYLDSLRNKWPSIDVLFCGFGGASYFPNTIHLEGKDDWEIGVVREQLFAHNFCRVVAGLAPRIAVPFAADFALLSGAQRWINQVRFPRRSLSSYYQSYFKSNGHPPKIYDMYPGDLLDLDELQTKSPYRKEMRDGCLNHLIDKQYSEEIAQLQQVDFISESDAAQLEEEIYRNIKNRIPVFGTEILRGLRFCLRVPDVPNKNCFDVAFNDGGVKLKRSGEPDPSCALTIDISSSILRHSFSSEWGGDAISIGYGCEIRILDRRAAVAGLDRVCVGLLTQHPTVKDHIKKQPLNALKHLISSPLRHASAFKKTRHHNLQNENYERNIWLLRSQDEIRRICGLPTPGAELTAEE
jgi:hypothetical protein